MSEWFDIMRELRTLRDGLNDAPMDTPALQKSLYRMAKLLHRMQLHTELQRNSAPRHSSLDPLDMTTLTLRFDALESEMRLGFRNVLAAIEDERPPQPPRGFDE
jgi:hypothetical protein